MDKVAEEFIRDHGGVPSFKNYNGTFPGSLCISVNEVVVHAFPGKYELRETDIISVDCGVYYKGFHSDSAYTYPLEGVARETLLLLERTYESLYLAIAQAKAIGLTIPDPDLVYDEATENWKFGKIDWDEFWRVVKGDGPCNRERLAARRKAHADGAWVREAALAYAAKHSSKAAVA